MAPKSATSRAPRRKAATDAGAKAAAPSRRGAGGSHRSTSEAAKPAARRSGKRKQEEQQATAEEPLHDETAALASPPKKRRVAPPITQLAPVHHRTHGKVPGTLFMWGNNGSGLLGMGAYEGEPGEVEEKRVPSHVNVGDKKVLQFAAGGMHSVALTEDGRVYTWGVNDEGALGRETEGPLWGHEGNPQGGDYVRSYWPGEVKLPAEALPIVQVSAGDSHTLMLTASGEVWGCGTFRRDGPYGFVPGVHIAREPVCVIEAAKPEERVVQIASGNDHALALTEGGAVLSWGIGNVGQLGRIGPRMVHNERESMLRPRAVPFRRMRTPTHIAEVACGDYTSFFITRDGRVFACGNGAMGHLGLNPDKSDAVWAPTLVPGLSNIEHVAGGAHHSFALGADGAPLLGFGETTYGKLGREGVDVNAAGRDHAPRAVDGLPEGETVVSVDAGIGVSGCVMLGGRIWTWGQNIMGLLAKASEDDDDDNALPGRVPLTKATQHRKFYALSFGGQHAGALASDPAPPPKVDGSAAAASPVVAEPAKPAAPAAVPEAGGAGGAQAMEG